MENTEFGNFTVLVEEEVLIRHLWTEYYRENNWPLEVFEDPFEFLSQIDRFKNRTENMYFFFDQDFGKVRGVGTELARAVKGLNVRQNVSLVTFHDEWLFQKELRDGLIHNVFEKYPELIFGPNFLSDRTKANPKLWELMFEESGAAARALGPTRDLEFTLEKHFPSLAPKPAPVVVKESVTINKPSSNPAKKRWWQRLILSPAYV
jgi:hypothetical protein